MRWRFDPFISIEVFHQKYTKTDPDTGMPLPAPDFEMTPTKACQAEMFRLGWIFKQVTGGAKVFIEKIYEPDGVARPRHELTDTVALDFLVRINNPGLLLTTKPFAAPAGDPPPQLPVFSGRRRMLYFDNRAESSSGAGEIDLTMNGEVRVENLASLAPVPFSFPVGFPTLQQLEARQMIASGPAGTSRNYSLNAQKNTAVLDLPEGPWKVTPQSGNSEIIYLDSSLMYENFLAIIRIFKSPGLGWDAQKKYKLLFSKV